MEQARVAERETVRDRENEMGRVSEQANERWRGGGGVVAFIQANLDGQEM